MGKAKGVQLINGKRPVRKSIITAIEYENGDLYFDRCGRVILSLKGLGTGWIRQKADPASTIVLNPELELTLDFNATRMSISRDLTGRSEEIEDQAIDSYVHELASVVPIIVDEFEVAAFERVGFREAYHFPADSVADAEAWVRDLGLFRVYEKVYRTFGEEHYALGCVVVVAGQECRYRIEVRGMERPMRMPHADAEVTVKESQAKRKDNQELLKLLKLKRDRQLAPAYAGVVDIDAFLWDTMDSDFQVADFVRRRAAENLPMFRECLAGSDGTGK